MLISETTRDVVLATALTGIAVGLVLSIAYKSPRKPRRRFKGAEICMRYPDQYVCLVDIVRPPLRNPEIITARVVGHGTTHDAAFDPIRDLGERYPRFAIRYTGVPTEPLIRPSLVFDDETLALLAEPLKRATLARR
ncbi:MAG: hypothetical protein ABI704_01435 [Kofleriaceae bacterium]